MADQELLYERACVAADAALARGEHCRAEALLRYAMSRAADAGGAERRRAAWLAAGLQRVPALPTPPTCAVICADFTYVLMRFDEPSFSHVPMTRVPERWLLVSRIASGGGKLSARCALVLDALVAHHNRELARSAFDPNFVGVADVAARLVDSREAKALAHALAPTAWTSEQIYAIDGARYAALTVDQLIAIACEEEPGFG